MFAFFDGLLYNNNVYIFLSGVIAVRNTVKRLIAVITVLSFLLLSVSFSGAIEIKRYYGDIDNDGVVSAVDAKTALLCALNIPGGELAGDDLFCADVDRDGSVTIGDARIILRTSSEIVPPEFMENYEFDPNTAEFTRLVNELRRSYSKTALHSVLCSDELCSVAEKAAEDFCVNTGNAFVNFDGTYFYELLREENISFTMADKIVVSSSSNYKSAFNKMIKEVQGKKAFLNGNFTKIGVGGYSADGRTFYWCVFLIK